MLLALLFSVQAAASPSPAEQAAIFKAAGFTRRGAEWKSGNCDGAESASYQSGRLETYRDLNGDGRPDAVVNEGGAICYGNTGVHFWLLSKQANGTWKPVHEETAIPKFLTTKGVGGWPDIEMGMPGMCNPIWRFNGRAYAIRKRCPF